MLSFHVKFVQTYRRTDRGTMVKQYASDLSMQGIKINVPACRSIQKQLDLALRDHRNLLEQTKHETNNENVGPLGD